MGTEKGNHRIYYYKKRRQKKIGQYTETEMPIEDVMNQSENIFKGLLSAIIDAHMLRYSQISVQRIQQPRIYNIDGQFKWHLKVVQKLGGNAYEETKVTVWPYMHPKATCENSVVTVRKENVWHPPSYWLDKDFEHKVDGVYYKG